MVFCFLFTIFTDWVVEQGSIINTTSNGEAAVALLLTEKGGGTLLSSTRYVHYGQITARRTYSFISDTFFLIQSLHLARSIAIAYHTSKVDVEIFPLIFNIHLSGSRGSLKSIMSLGQWLLTLKSISCNLMSFLDNVPSVQTNIIFKFLDIPFRLLFFQLCCSYPDLYPL